MQNGNQWQQKNYRNQGGQHRNIQYDNRSNNGGNWVQQKSLDTPSFKADDKKPNEGLEHDEGGYGTSLMPPPTPPNLSNVQSRLSYNKFNNKDKFSKGPPPMNKPPPSTNQHQQGNPQQHGGGGNQQRNNNWNTNRMDRGGGGGRGGNYTDKIKERVNKELAGPQYDLPPLVTEEKKFNSHCRLFVGNLSREANHDELKEAFAKFGELGQVYFNKDSAYGFVSFDYKNNAEKAVRELQGKFINGRPLTVRFATVSSGIKLKNLTPFISNELLEKSFNVFGEVETSRVTVDSRGKPTGEAIIIFSEKKAASMAIKKCDEDCYFLTSSLRPVIVEPLDESEDTEGLPEASLNKNEMYRKDREIGPHFANQSSFQYEYGLRWKQLFYLFNEKKTALEHDFQTECEALEAKLSVVKHEYETDQLRRELAAREAESSYLHAEAEYRMSSASLTTFHATMGPGGANQSGNNYDNQYEQYDHRPQQYDRNYNRGSSYGYDHHSEQSFDNSFTQGSNTQTFNIPPPPIAVDRSVDVRNELSGVASSAETTVAATEQVDDISSLNQSTPLSSRLAGRLQDRRPEDGSPPASMEQGPLTSPPAEDSSQNRTSGGGANRSMDNNRFDNVPQNKTYNRTNDHNDLNRSLSSRQMDRPIQDQAIKRPRY